MTKSILNQVKSRVCSISSHQWEQWVLKDNICTNIRKCKRCGEEEKQPVKHAWGGWKLAEGKCVQIRACTHCGQKDKQPVKHSWGEWKSIENQCVQIRLCTHCGKKEEAFVGHNWGDWDRNKNCIDTRICIRCSKEETRGKPNHVWGDWKNTEEHNCGNNRKVRECEQCHEKEISEIYLVHTWGEWEFNIEKCTKERTCLICGKKETISHDYELIDKTYHDSKKAGSGDDYDYYYRCEYRCKRCGDVQTQMRSDWQRDEW